MARSRKVEVSYYDMLDAYFQRLYIEPLNNAERALMASILHLCNRARGSQITMSTRLLAANCLMSHTTVVNCLEKLHAKKYLTLEKSSNNCTINVQCLYQDCTEIVYESSNDCTGNVQGLYGNCTKIRKNVQATSHFSGQNKIKQNKIKQNKGVNEDFLKSLDELEL